MAPHSSTLAWKILWVEEPGRLQSMGSLRVGHDWATSLSLFTFTHWRRKWQPRPIFLPGKSHGQLSNSEATTTVGFLCAECPQLLCHVPLCDPMDCSLPGSSVHRIFQARIMEWVAMPSSRGSSQPRDGTWVSCTEGRFFTTEPPGNPRGQATGSPNTGSCSGEAPRQVSERDTGWGQLWSQTP